MSSSFALQERAASGVQGDEEGVVAGLRQGLRERSTALEASQDQLRLREEEVQDLSHHLQAAQADIASLQVQPPRHCCVVKQQHRQQLAEFVTVPSALCGNVAGMPFVSVTLHHHHHSTTPEGLIVTCPAALQVQCQD